MKTAAAVVATLASAVFGQQLPQFAPDWSAVVVQTVAIDQGGYNGPNGDLCCSAKAPQCKIQTVYEAAKQYFSVTQQAVFLANPDGSGVVQDFKSLKEYAVDATHTCQSYCPIDPQDAPLTRLGYGENATDEGATTIAGHQVEDIFWRVAIPILNLTVQESHFYTDISSPFSRSNAGPVLEADSIGFGSEQLIHQNASYDQFKAGAIDPSMFKVINNATCPMSNQCQGDDDQGSNDNFPPTADATEVADFAVSTFPGCPRSRVLRAGLNRYSSAESARRALLAADSVRGAVEAAGSVDALIAQAMEQMPHRAKGLRATPEQLRAVVAGAIGKEL